VNNQCIRIAPTFLYRRRAVGFLKTEPVKFHVGRWPVQINVGAIFETILYFPALVKARILGARLFIVWCIDPLLRGDSVNSGRW
jgi:hypothetical protein